MNHQRLVDRVFNSVAAKYDLMNDIMSFGLHRIWKKKFIKYVEMQRKVLDVACGTGDIASALTLSGHEVVACDVNPVMLREGRRKSLNRGIIHDWVECSADNMPFANKTFDGCTIAFGIRNIENREAALGEMLRVLRPGGKFACLEFSKVEPAPLATLYESYSKFCIPRIGSLIANDRAAYEYLVRSIAAFPDATEFSAIIKNCGFVDVGFDTMSCGVVAIHYGSKSLSSDV